jgi:hypothetical protein
LNSLPITDKPLQTLIGQAAQLYALQSAHPHHETHEIDMIDGERRVAHRLHSLPHVALLENTLAIRSHDETVHTEISHDTLDAHTHSQITRAIDQSISHVMRPVQQQFH